MKQKIFKVLSIVLIALVLFPCTVAVASNFSEKVDIFYKNIKIYIDGTEITPKDATGNIVEPFIYNGTTYLPVRAIANAFGQDVEWNGKTHSVYIGKKDETEPDNYLHKIQYNKIEKIDRVSFSVLKNNIQDVDGNVYTNGLLFKKRQSDTIKVYYPLNSQYSKLKGNIVIPKGYDADDTTVKFYGDDDLLYEATVTYSMPFKFDIDISGINQLTISVSNEGPDYYGADCALTDLALYE